MSSQRKNGAVVSVTLNPCIDHAFFTGPLELGAKNLVEKCETDAGGKGVNFARVIHRLGGHAMATGFYGGPTGAELIGILTAEGVPHDFIRISGRTRVNIAIESGAEPPTFLDAKGPHVFPEELSAIVEEVKILCIGAAWVALGGAIPPGVPSDVYVRLGRIARRAGAKVVLDADGEVLRESLSCRPHLIKPNRAEAESLLNRPIIGIEDAAIAADEIRDWLQNSDSDPSYSPMVLISLGATGAVMACGDGTFIGTSPKVRTSSTVGSGDSMLAAFIWAFEEGKSLPECLRWGLAAGAATAETSGNEIASKRAIEALLPRATVSSASGAYVAEVIADDCRARA